MVCDRFIDSSRAYQGGGSGLSDAEIVALHRIGSAGLLPDVTVLVEVSAGAAAYRLALRDQGTSDRIGGRNLAYHAKVLDAFGRFAAAEPQRFVRVDGDGSPEATHGLVIAALSAQLGAA